MDVLELEVTRAQSDGFGNAFCDQPSLNSCHPCQGNRSAVVGVKAFCLNDGLAGQPEASLAAMLGRMLVHCLPRAGLSGEEEKFAISKDAVYVEQHQLDLLRSGLGIWHGP